MKPSNNDTGYGPERNSYVSMYGGAGPNRRTSALSSQAYCTGKLKLVGVWLQIFLLYGTLVAFPLMGLRHLTSPVLRGFGMERRFFLKDRLEFRTVVLLTPLLGVLSTPLTCSQTL